MQSAGCLVSTHPPVLLVVEGVVVVVSLTDPPVPAGPGDAGQEGDEGPEERDGHCNIILSRVSSDGLATHTTLPPGPEPRPE